MDTINIDTTQNIAIEQQIASVGERIAASLFDYLFIFSFLILSGIISATIENKTFMFVAGSLVLFYPLLSEIFMDGQTWGKKIMKIKVVKMDGTPTSFSSFFIRWLIQLVEIVAMFGSVALVAIIFNRKGQRLGDIAANTTVIKLRERSLTSSIYIAVPENYEMVYPEVSRLSTNDIYTINEVLEAIQNPQDLKMAYSLATDAQSAFEKKLSVKSAQKPELFLQTLLHDYNHLNSKV